jgi:ABC-type branched-subunit amino acid transport system ATPase component
MLAVAGLDQYYGGSHILRGVGFEVPLGQVTVLLGRNGVGKTTLLKTLMGLVPATRGSVRFEGRDITRLAPYHRARAGLGYVPQGREILPRLTVEENLRMGLATRPTRTAIPARRSSHAFATGVPGLNQPAGVVHDDVVVRIDALDRAPRVYVLPVLDAIFRDLD